MSDEEKKLLEDTAESVEECLTILKRMQRSRRFELFIKIGYWMVVLGMAASAYYFIQPYLESLMSMYNNLSGNINHINNIKDGALNFKLF